MHMHTYTQFCSLISAVVILGHHFKMKFLLTSYHSKLPWNLFIRNTMQNGSEDLSFFLLWLTRFPGGQCCHWGYLQVMSFTILNSRCIMPSWALPHFRHEISFAESSVDIIHRNRYCVLHVHPYSCIPQSWKSTAVRALYPTSQWTWQ